MQKKVDRKQPWPFAFRLFALIATDDTDETDDHRFFFGSQSFLKILKVTRRICFTPCGVMRKDEGVEKLAVCRLFLY
jgi:hypothetical protein